MTDYDDDDDGKKYDWIKLITGNVTALLMKRMKKAYFFLKEFERRGLQCKGRYSEEICARQL